MKENLSIEEKLELYKSTIRNIRSLLAIIQEDLYKSYHEYTFVQTSTIRLLDEAVKITEIYKEDKG